MKCDIAVVGAGVLGVTTAFRLTELYDWSVADPDAAERSAIRGRVHPDWRPHGLTG